MSCIGNCDSLIFLNKDTTAKGSREKKPDAGMIWWFKSEGKWGEGVDCSSSAAALHTEPT